MKINFEGTKCQEANLLGICYPGTDDPVPCNKPGFTVVWHNNDGKHLYIMCEACASHNIKNRRGIELIPA